MDRGDWRAIVHRFEKSWIRMKQLIGWEREGYANCTLVAAEATKKGGGHLTAL